MKPNKYIRAVVINRREFVEAIQEIKSAIIGTYNEDEILKIIGRKIKGRINKSGIKSLYSMPTIIECPIAEHNENAYKLHVTDITCKNNVVTIHLYFHVK